MPDWLVELLRYLITLVGVFILLGLFLGPKGRRYR